VDVHVTAIDNIWNAQNTTYVVGRWSHAPMISSPLLWSSDIYIDMASFLADQNYKGDGMVDM
jgi:hypothetical protein